MRGALPGIVAAFLLLAAMAVPASAQSQERIFTSISYVTPGTVYLRAGTVRGLAAGDTLVVTRRGSTLGMIVVSATSSSSSSATIVRQDSAFAVEDSAYIDKVVAPPPSPPQTSAGAQRKQPGDAFPVSPVSGRVALQYAGSGAPETGVTLAMPAVVLRLDATRLGGTDLALSLHGRVSTQRAPSHRSSSREVDVRMYELSLTSGTPGRWYGFGVGRLFPAYAGGIGLVDGAEFYVRSGRVTVGLLGGAQPDYTSSGVDTRLQKFALYANIRWGGEVFATSNVTIAYGQQLNRGKPDRDFLYLQTFFRPGGSFFVNGSSEFDLHIMRNGTRTRRLRLTNSFISVNYTPPWQWLTMSAGYDATRLIYLFESMKLFPDSLLDRSLREGFRGSLSISLPFRFTLSGNGTFRFATRTTAAARTLGGGIRASGIFGTGFGAGISAADIRGLYADGTQLTLDLDSWFASGTGASVRFDRYRYRMHAGGVAVTTTTAGISVSQRVFRTLFGTISADQVWEEKNRSWRLYAELGIHF